jgi:hypothetical protein
MLPRVKLSPSNVTIGFFITHNRAVDEFDLDAPYQRGQVWNEAQQIALIKSVLMGLPIGAIVLSKLPYSNDGDGPSFRVIDGKQRILAVRKFCSNQLTIPSGWLPEQCNYGGPDQLVPFGAGGEYLRRWIDNSAPMPALIYDGTRTMVRYEKVRAADGRWIEQAIWRTNTAAEILAGEAEIFGLINATGVPQTTQTLNRAAELSQKGQS